MLSAVYMFLYIGQGACHVKSDTRSFVLQYVILFFEECNMLSLIQYYYKTNILSNNVQDGSNYLYKLLFLVLSTL